MYLDALNERGRKHDSEISVPKKNLSFELSNDIPDTETKAVI